MQKQEIYAIQTKYTFKAAFHSRANVAPYLRKCGNHYYILPIWEILVITWQHARRWHHGHTNVK